MIAQIQSQSGLETLQPLYYTWYGHDVPSTSGFAPPVREGLCFARPKYKENFYY